MSKFKKSTTQNSAREKFLGLSLESTRKSYYPQLKEQLEAARTNERKLQLLVDNLPARISYVDREERLVMSNQPYAAAYGLDKRVPKGEHLRDIVGVLNFEKMEPFIHKALEGEHVQREIQLTDREGGKEIVEINYVPDMDAQGEVIGFYDLSLDITERKRAEQEKARLESKLREVQKMEAVGTLAGGIAHDFNNLLMAILGHISLMSMSLGGSDPNAEHLKAMEKYIQKATNLTKQLLGTARGGKYNPVATDLNELVENSASMFGRTKKEIVVETELSEELLVSEVDRQQIDQVLLNMYVNAWQAMSSGGNLRVTTSFEQLEEKACAHSDLTPGPYAKIDVADNGSGMDEATVKRIFEPFFTTKEKGQGTGLGLSSAYGIITNHGGCIQVKSTPGIGTVFTIYLPLSAADPRQETQQKEKVRTGNETILLVDDEKMILDVGKALLKELGYNVLVAPSGRRALEILASQGGVNLVILDLIMPEMDGGETFDQIKALYPSLPVILSSGYAVRGQASAIMRKGCNAFLQKPFNMTQLSKTLSKVFNES